MGLISAIAVQAEVKASTLLKCAGAKGQIEVYADNDLIQYNATIQGVKSSHEIEANGLMQVKSKIFEITQLKVKPFQFIATAYITYITDHGCIPTRKPIQECYSSTEDVKQAELFITTDFNDDGQLIFSNLHYSNKNIDNTIKLTKDDLGENTLCILDIKN